MIPWFFHLIWSRSVLKWMKRWTICNLLPKKIGGVHPTSRLSDAGLYRRFFSVISLRWEPFFDGGAAWCTLQKNKIPEIFGINPIFFGCLWILSNLGTSKLFSKSFFSNFSRLYICLSSSSLFLGSVDPFLPRKNPPTKVERRYL